MAWRSPYHDRKPDGLSPRTRDRISRGTLLATGLVMAYFSGRGIVRLHEIYTIDPQPLFVYTPYGRRYRPNVVLLLPWVVVIGCGLLAVTMIGAALLRVEAMQRLFERFGRPPTTGDRGGDNDAYGGRWWPW